MDYFKIDLENITMHSQLHAIKICEKVWNTYAKNKIIALRLITFAMNMTEWSLSNPYAGNSLEERRQIMQSLYFPDEPNITESKDYILLHRVFKAREKDRPGQKDLKIQSESQVKLRVILENVNPTETTLEEGIIFANLITKTGKAAQELIEAQLKIYSKQKESFDDVQNGEQIYW